MENQSPAQKLIEKFLEDNELRTQDLELYLHGKGIVTISEEDYEKLEWREE